MFSKPLQIISDRGTAFTSQEFADFVKYSNIKHRQVVVAAPWANGIVERVNRFLKSSLTKFQRRERVEITFKQNTVCNKQYLPFGSKIEPIKSHVRLRTMQSR